MIHDGTRYIRAGTDRWYKERTSRTKLHLVQSGGEGWKEALHAIVEGLVPFVFCIIARKVRDGNDLYVCALDFLDELLEGTLIRGARPEKGRLKDYVAKSALNHAGKWRAREARARMTPLGDLDVPQPETAEEIHMDEETARRVFDETAARTKEEFAEEPTTWTAFYRWVLKDERHSGPTMAELAKELKVSVRGLRWRLEQGEKTFRRVLHEVCTREQGGSGEGDRE